MSESQLPYGYSALLIFMSQTDQRQLSLSLCLSLSLPFQTAMFVLIFFACVTLHLSGTLGQQRHGKWYTPQEFQASLIRQHEGTPANTSVRSQHHYPGEKIQLKKGLTVFSLRKQDC